MVNFKDFFQKGRSFTPPCIAHDVLVFLATLSGTPWLIFMHEFLDLGTLPQGVFILTEYLTLECLMDAALMH
jgi:hypothetical protein